MKEKQITLIIDDEQVTVYYGTTILKAAEKINIKIPTLCFHKDLCMLGTCRICVVEVVGLKTLQAACAFPITEPIVVKTTTPKIMQARKHILSLLLSDHYGDCYTCKKNMNCEFQALSADYGINALCFGRKTPIVKTKSENLKFGDITNWPIQYDPDKCILCYRCVRACTGNFMSNGVLGISNRTNNTKLTTFKDYPLNKVTCINCGQCVVHCPTGALTERDDTKDIWKELADKTKHVIIQTAPAPRAAIGECFGIAPGYSFTFEMNTALRRCGFSKVFDTNFSAPDFSVFQ